MTWNYPERYFLNREWKLSQYYIATLFDKSQAWWSTIKLPESDWSANWGTLKDPGTLSCCFPTGWRDGSQHPLSFVPYHRLSALVCLVLTQIVMSMITKLSFRLHVEQCRTKRGDEKKVNVPTQSDEMGQLWTLWNFICITRSHFLMLNIGMFTQWLVLFIFLSTNLLTKVCLNERCPCRSFL